MKRRFLLQISVETEKWCDCVGKNASSVNPFTGKEVKASEKGLFGSTGSGLFSRNEAEPPVSIFSKNAETVGNLMQERKPVDWNKAKINISKETMEVVEMECKMNPEYSEKFSKLDWGMILYHRWDCWIPWAIFDYLFLLRIMSEVSSKKRNHQSKTERILDVFQWIGMIM